ncbi:hypothetical protein BX666DRAFT_1977266 [Dichotomocladium elegans]|nr:hypothetical protein BX666DRAFT_1977266 [Dichotomocladium elegans]
MQHSSSFEHRLLHNKHMGNSLKIQSSNAVAQADDSASHPSNANGITIRVNPHPSPPSSASSSSERSSSPTFSGCLRIPSPQLSLSSLLSTSPTSGHERRRSNRSISLKSIKSWNFPKTHDNRRESDPVPESSLPPSPSSVVPNRAFTDVLFDALQLTEFDYDRLLPCPAKPVETEDRNTAERDWIREYFESIESSDVSEQDIEQRRYYIFQRVWHKDIQVPLADPTLIIHWACGAGPWETSVARQFPTCRVVGVDFRSMDHCQGDKNSECVEFRHLSLNDREEYHGLDGFQDNSVDLVVMRRVWFLGDDTCRWVKMLAQVHKILKPGGWIEIYDVDRPVVPCSDNPNESKCISQIEEWRSNIRKVMVGFPAERRQIYRILIDTGFIRLDGCCVDVPVGEWTSTQDLRETGYLVKELRWRYIKQIGRWIREINRISVDEFQETLNGALRELDQCRAHMNWICLTAQKPRS